MNQRLKPYTKHQLQNWKSSNKIIVFENLQQLYDFVEKAKNRENPGKKLYFGIISDKTAELVQSELGYDIKNYNCALYSDNVRKIFKDHGDEIKENLRGQRAIYEKDFANIPEIIGNPDSIEAGEAYQKQPVIKFKKDGITIIAIVSSGALDLYTQTMYISQKNRSLATATDEQASVNTPTTTRSTASNSSITKKQKNTRP